MPSISPPYKRSMDHHAPWGRFLLCAGRLCRGLRRWACPCPTRAPMLMAGPRRVEFVSWVAGYQPPLPWISATVCSKGARLPIRRPNRHGEGDGPIGRFKRVLPAAAHTAPGFLLLQRRRARRLLPLADAPSSPASNRLPSPNDAFGHETGRAVPQTGSRSAPFFSRTMGIGSSVAANRGADGDFGLHTGRGFWVRLGVNPCAAPEERSVPALSIAGKQAPMRPLFAWQRRVPVRTIRQSDAHERPSGPVHGSAHGNP